MAHLLAKLGKEALRPQNIGGVWRKAAVSAKNTARLRKETLLEGRWVKCMPSTPLLRRNTSYSCCLTATTAACCSEWEFDEPRKPERQRKPKGHKHDRLKPQRCEILTPSKQCKGGDAPFLCGSVWRRRLTLPVLLELLLQGTGHPSQAGHHG